ncbi:MAG: hypothetical protein HQ596_03510 [Candidatus Saganbacteria bacterium]|nr:hypothetical protein [Candidatus Saganbacteria bacterium]
MRSVLRTQVSLIESRSRLNQNVIIDKQGLRIGTKVWIRREHLPQSIRNSDLPLCIALRGPVDLAKLIRQISGNKKLLSGKVEQARHSGVLVTSKFERLLLVAPDFQRVGKFVSPPLGLERIAAYLRHTNRALDVQIFEPNLTGQISDKDATGPQDPRLARNMLFEHVRGQDYDVVGFSALTPTLDNDVKNLMQVDAAFADTDRRPIFMLGNYGSLLGAEALFGALSPLDAIVWGPGEYPLGALFAGLQRLKQGDLKGEALRKAALSLAVGMNQSQSIIAIREGARGSDSETQQFPSLDVEQLAIHQSLIDQYAIDYPSYWKSYVKGKRRNLRFHLSTTSCRFGCLFCATSKGEYGFVPVEVAVENFRHARRAYPDIRDFSFTDDNLFTRRSYPLALAEGIKSLSEWEEDFTIYCQARADSVRDTDGDHQLLATLRQAGLRKVAVGIESFSAKELRELNKGTLLRNVAAVIPMLVQHDISPIAGLILFPPNVILEDLYITSKRALEVSKDPRVQIDPNFRLAAYSGAPLTRAQEQGFVGRGKMQEALTASWVGETSIVYKEEFGLQIPRHFRIIRERMDQLCDKTECLSQEALQATGIHPNDLGAKGLLIIWSIISIVNRNPKLFDDSNAGNGAGECLGEFVRLLDDFSEVIRIRYPKKAEIILSELDQLEIPTLG